MTEFEATLTQIAADILPALKANPNKFTAEILVANWVGGVEWLGFKVGGKAWRREVVSHARSAWVATFGNTMRSIPASEETLAWGGFLGGEVYHDQDARQAAEITFNNKYGMAA